MRLARVLLFFQIGAFLLSLKGISNYQATVSLLLYSAVSGVLIGGIYAAFDKERRSARNQKGYLVVSCYLVLLWAAGLLVHHILMPSCLETGNYCNELSNADFLYTAPLLLLLPVGLLGYRLFRRMRLDGRK